MNLTITKWLLVYVLEHKHTFYVIHFLSLTVHLSKIDLKTEKWITLWQDRMAAGRVLVYGGRGGLGSVVVSTFKANSWWVLSVDTRPNDEADENVVVDISPDAQWTGQEQVTATWFFLCFFGFFVWIPCGVKTPGPWVFSRIFQKLDISMNGR